MTLVGTESGRIHGVGQIGLITMFLEGQGSFAGGQFSYTCRTTARIRPEIPSGEAQSADVNGDRRLDVSDAISFLSLLFTGGEPRSSLAAETNGDGEVNLSDAVFLLNFLFGGGPAPSSEWRSSDETRASISPRITRS